MHESLVWLLFVFQGPGNRLWHISDLHAAYDPLHFVLLHPYGEPGWHMGLKHRKPPVLDTASRRPRAPRLPTVIEMLRLKRTP
jgi:L-ascorbate metabolism protein UlaG (beta-lactamase superfamily)